MSQATTDEREPQLVRRPASTRPRVTASTVTICRPNVENGGGVPHYWVIVIDGRPCMTAKRSEEARKWCEVRYGVASWSYSFGMWWGRENE